MLPGGPPEEKRPAGARHPSDGGAAGAGAGGHCAPEHSPGHCLRGRRCDCGQQARGTGGPPGPGHPDGTLVNALLYHCGDSLSGINGEKRPGIVHRIDRDTSGLIIVAKNDAAHLALAAQLEDHTLARVYECVVQGKIPDDAGTIDAPIARNPNDRKKMAVVPGGAGR